MKKRKKEPFKWNAKQLKWFWYWINERHRIYEARKKDPEGWPWTKDKILKEYKFTNVFRQLDRVTQEWTNRYVTLIGQGDKKKAVVKDEDLFFHCAMFRLFNWPATYDALYFGMPKWSYKKAMKILRARQKKGEQIFTGAYIIPNAGREDPKIQVISEALDKLYDGRTKRQIEDGVKPNRRVFIRKIMRGKSMRKATKLLQKIPTIGPFIAYEIVCDLRHTKLLSHARDMLSWANPGPGAQRGIHRLMLGTRHWPKGTPRPDYNQAMRQLLVESAKAVGKHVKKCEWPFEMREIEHSLCEFDKYMRVKNGEGRPRSKYVYKDPPF